MIQLIVSSWGRIVKRIPSYHSLAWMSGNCKWVFVLAVKVAFDAAARNRKHTNSSPQMFFPNTARFVLVCIWLLAVVVVAFLCIVTVFHTER